MAAQPSRGARNARPYRVTETIEALDAAHGAVNAYAERSRAIAARCLAKVQAARRVTR